MSKKNKINRGLDDYLNTLEQVKMQYQQYVEVSDLYKLPTQSYNETIQYQTPSSEHPLTTNTFALNNRE